MTRILKRRRGTAIVETDKGILLTAGSRGKPYILLGGGANRGESRFVATLRELTEETHLRPYYAEIIFKHLGEVRLTKSGHHKFQDHHTVCLVKATGNPRPGGGDAKRIAYYFPGCDVRISSTTREIIEKYYRWKSKCEPAQTIDEDDNDVEDVEAENLGGYDEDEE